MKTMTRIDHSRISLLLEDVPNGGSGLLALEEALAQADIVDPAEAPADLVTMNTKIRGRMVDGRAGVKRILTLVYPRDADIAEGKVSLYTPCGVELLGARAGEVVTWRGVDGVTRGMAVDGILYQPEASGDWHL